jgi:multidrug resistance protein
MILSGFAFLHPLSETMIAPSTNTIASDLHIKEPFAKMTFLSIFLVGIGLGPLLFGPLSELHGRRPIILLANVIYIAWNTACGFAQTGGQLIAFRVFSGLGASVALSVGGGVLGDIWRPEERGKAIAAYGLAPLLGPALGPVAGGFITDGISWRWVFYIFSLVSLALFIIAVFLYPETYEPTLLAKLASTDAKRRNNSGSQKSKEADFIQRLKTALTRPARILASQVIVQIFAVYLTVMNGVMFLFLFTFSFMWTDHYGQSVHLGSLNYISTGLGFAAGSQRMLTFFSC